MSSYQEDAERVLSYGYSSIDQRLKQAEIYAYMARTEKMTPPPAEKAALPKELYLVSVINEKSQTISVELHMNQLSANSKLREYSRTSIPEGWEVSIQPVKFAS